jgi:hypothetical protein
MTHSQDAILLQQAPILDTPAMAVRLAGVFLALGLAVALPRPAAASGPAITVTPATGLHSQQVVHVSAAGFKPGTLLVVTECADKGTATGPDDCDLAHEQLVHAAKNGSVESSYRVTPGVFAPNRIDCTAVDCVISVSELSFDPSQQASAEISFASGVHTSAGSTGGSTAQSPGNLSIDWLIPFVAALLWAFCVALRKRLRENLALVAAGFVAIGLSSLQAYAVAASTLVPSRISSATVYGLYFVGLEVIVLLYLGMAHFRGPRGQRPWVQRTYLATAVLNCAGTAWVIWVAVATMAQSSATDGGGPIWYAAAGVCAAGAATGLLAKRPRRI